ncbi:MAG TPA: polyphosphate kinase 2 [Micropepsaceae bacterium]|nr:polyphosphate kinase 2 [Micropepsaceae bacterium]
MAVKDKEYQHTLRALQIELVKLQRDLIETGARVLVIIEGRDGAGKDGTIKRLVEHMSPRETPIFAPPKPSDRESHQWYYQRFVRHLPSDGEFVFFNRSWYNRCGVERVMGFCTDSEVEEFFDTVKEFESLLVRSGLSLRKYYLDISKDEQKQRLAERMKDPLKAWKSSPVDAVAVKKWKAYSKARDEMFLRTSHGLAPWRVVRADHKKHAHLGVLRDLLDSFSYPGKKNALVEPDRETVFIWAPGIERDRVLAR